MEALLQLKAHLTNDKDELLSISQQKSVRLCLELVVTLGLLPNLLPGVGMSIEHRSSHAQKIFIEIAENEEPASNEEKFERVVVVTKSLWILIEEETLNGLILPRYMVDLLAALCQLVFAPFKNPTPELMAIVAAFKNNLDHVIANSHKPVIISELMLIQGNKKCPKWMKIGIGKLLTNRLLDKNGVIATVQAIQYSSSKNNPKLLTGLDAVARLITSPLVTDAVKYSNIIVPQVIELIRSEDPTSMKIGVSCIRSFYENNKTSCTEMILFQILDPLINPSVSLPKQEVSQCIVDLHRCFAFPGGEKWSVPIGALSRYCGILKDLFMATVETASSIRTLVEDILWKVLCYCDCEGCEEPLQILTVVLFDENPYENYHSLPEDITFEVENDEIKFCHVKFGSRAVRKLDRSILKLIKKKDISGCVSKRIFIFLMKCSLSSNEDLSEKKVFISECLADLAECSKVQKSILQDPVPVVDFITSFVDKNLDQCDKESEMICLSLMLLSIILNDMIVSNKAEWSIFGKVMVSLPLLSRKTANNEIKTLSDEIYKMIVCQGAAGERVGRTFKFYENERSECAKALEDACNELLPVRGHAMIILAKLISQGDSEAKAKKNAILCIFQENIKHEDSYLYLTAIEGLACLATEYPDIVLTTLAEECVRSEGNVKLKVGESLMRVIRNLGEMAPVYKSELINALLSGVRDSDFLVRASSLSNVGELCKLLGYRIGSIIEEILNCVECVVLTDKCPEPRRAAVLLVTLLLRGLSTDALQVLQPILVRLYRALKRTYQLDKDDVTKLHAQLALQEIDSIVQEFLCPPENFSKRIYVLDRPS
ncbi:transport and Golgi organization protein 6 homolog [Nilaparvata lugens]|uniref:transport and Golgi organization protein 6 homolog n=1 Tax=Nilaparvata lugens TaxID=108931 RepID=UPI00193DCA03|nr:transport and Golgi organization protein 6 homolog [Nilaparvata lugens]